MNFKIIKMLNVISFIISTSLFARSETFDPSIYTPIDYKYKKLEIKPKLDMSGYDWENYSDSSYNYSGNEYSYHNFNIDGILKYSNTISEMLKFKYLFFNPEIGFSINNDAWKESDSSMSIFKLDNEYDKSFTPRFFTSVGVDLFKYKSYNGKFNRIALSINAGINKSYYKRDDRLAFGSSLFYSLSQDTIFQHYYTSFLNNDSYPYRCNLYVKRRELRSTPIFYDASFTFGLGVGRINYVTYSAVANHTIKYLYKKNKLTKNDKNTLLELAKLYEKLKRERTFDSRDARIEHFSKICQWLKDTNVSKELTMVEAMNLLDQWEYAFNQSRSIGSRFMVGIKSDNKFKSIFTKVNEITWSADSTITDSNNLQMKDLIPKLKDNKQDTSYKDNNAFSIDREGLTIEYKFAKPINMKGQFDFSANIFGGVEIDNSDTSYTDLNFFGEFLSNISYSWYPNIRSIFKISTGFEYEKIYWDYGKERYFNWDIISVDVNGSINYFISPKITASVNGHYSFDNKIKRNSNIRFKDLNYYYSLRGEITFKVF